MVGLIQDYRDWRAACIAVRKAEKDLYDYRQSIEQIVSSEEFIENVKKQESITDIENSRASSCFFRKSDSIYGYEGASQSQETVYIPQRDTCVYNYVGTVYIDWRCGGCSNKQDLTKDKFLLGQVIGTKHKRRKATRQLLSHFWKFKTKGKTMKKSEEYESLLKNVYETQKEMKTKENLITTQHDVLYLDKPAPITSCINKFDKVSFAHTQDDTGFTLECEHFCANDMCDHVKCDWFPRNADYVVARDRYLVAKSNLARLNNESVHVKEN